LVCAIASGSLGGLLNADPGHLQIVAEIHPMAPSAVPFGMALMIVGWFVVQPSQAWRCVVIPFVVTTSFASSGTLMEAAERRMRAGASAAMFGMELIAGGGVGMALIGLTLFAAGLLTVWDAVRFVVIGAVAAALCVVLVNCFPQLMSQRNWLFLTMCVWQCVMVCYFAWLGANVRKRAV
jgi:hypothetical protein